MRCRARSTVQDVAAWREWMGGLGGSLTDMGAPFGESTSVNGGAKSGASGYSIVEASSLDDAKAMAQGCPILQRGGTMELVLTGAAACTAFDVVVILKKARQRITDCVVEAEAQRAASEPKVFTRIHLIYRVRGKGLQRAQVERAVKLSKEKYCSATAMLAKTAEVSFEIVLEEA